MAEIRNGASGHLAIEAVHDGPCGIQAGDGTIVAFRWARRGVRPDQAVGRAAMLDGEPFFVASAARSKITEGFYVLRLERAGV
ncbi:hypothetical protein ACFOMD_01755 [Sphingoaurantiacus capsulatus]|uniref:Uncharacterized protein n=1 Tax=Sphingoaurantiacus capsulatus TaxID=1771310 RepID=A0ABV7X5R0_9SPHN